MLLPTVVADFAIVNRAENATKVLRRGAVMQRAARHRGVGRSKIYTICVLLCSMRRSLKKDCMGASCWMYGTRREVKSAASVELGPEVNGRGEQPRISSKSHLAKFIRQSETLVQTRLMRTSTEVGLVRRLVL